MYNIHVLNTIILKRKSYTHPYVHCSITYNSQEMETTLTTIMDNERICGMYIHTHKYYSRKSCYLQQHGRILKHYTTWNKGEEDISCDLTCRWNLTQQQQNPKCTATEWWLPEAGGDGGAGQIGLRESKVQAFSYKINKHGNIIGSSDGKQSACNAGDPGSIPG